MSIRSELETLQSEHGGVLQPEAAVQWAEKNKKSALHHALEWNDKKAGHQFRVWQIRQLISVHIRNDHGIREVVSLSIDRNSDGGGYRELTAVMSTKKLRDILLNDALQELERVRLKYERLTELANVWSAIEQAASRKRKVA